MKRILIAAAVFLAGIGLAGAQQNSPTPTGAVQSVSADNVGTTGAVQANLPAAAGKTTYICGFSVSAGSATTAIVTTVTVGTLLGGNVYTWNVGVPATAAGVTAAPLTVNFSPCVPANAPNTIISVSSGATGTGGVSNNVQSWGYQQ